MQAVGLAVGAKVMRTEHGCVPSYVGMLAAAFGDRPEADLLREFGKGRTHLVMVHHGKPLLRGKEYDWVDVRETYREVLAVVAARSRRPAPARGRPSGLAGSEGTSDA
ncbi:MAG: hypothetical protein C0501_03420 [Isosphaera sp.]|nr:hypothetical protein [Isosphaera sp.]